MSYKKVPSIMTVRDNKEYAEYRRVLREEAQYKQEQIRERRRLRYKFKRFIRKYFRYPMWRILYGILQLLHFALQGRFSSKDFNSFRSWHWDYED